MFDQTGVNCLSYMPAKGQPGNLKGANTPYACPTMTTQYGAQYHTYKARARCMRRPGTPDR